MKTKIFVRKSVSKSGKPYVAIVLDIGYRDIFINSPRDNTTHLAAELLGISVAELMTKSDGDYEVI